MDDEEIQQQLQEEAAGGNPFGPLNVHVGFALVNDSHPTQSADFGPWASFFSAP